MQPTARYRPAVEVAQGVCWAVGRASQCVENRTPAVLYLPHAGNPSRGEADMVVVDYGPFGGVS